MIKLESDKIYLVSYYENLHIFHAHKRTSEWQFEILKQFSFHNTLKTPQFQYLDFDVLEIYLETGELQILSELHRVMNLEELKQEFPEYFI